MKKLGIALLILLFAGSAYAQLGTTKATEAIGRMLGPNSLVVFPPFETPPTCNAAAKGGFYRDTDDDNPYYCDGSSWQTLALGSGLTVGTANTIPKWNVTPDDLTDSNILNAGIPAAGAGGSIVSISPTLNAGNSADDDIYILHLDVTNADHSAGLDVAGIFLELNTQDANATESGILFDSSWDWDLNHTAAASIKFTDTIQWAESLSTMKFVIQDVNASNQGSDFVTIAATPVAIDDDTIRMLYINTTGGADHSGGNVYGADVSLSAADAQATEVGVKFSSNWDVVMSIPGGADGRFHWDGAATLELASGNFNINVGALDDSGGTNAFNVVPNSSGYSTYGTALEQTAAVVGAAQNVAVDSAVIRVSAGAGASILTFGGNSQPHRIAIVCDDSNVTITDSDGGGAANTVNLAGATTDFTCTADDVVYLQYLLNPGAGNDRWVEVGRSVN
jgi:hypothetical protein